MTRYEVNARLSPDGKKVAYQKIRYVFDIAGNKEWPHL